jgi:outer membrane protein assembly factor BamB
VVLALLVLLAAAGPAAAYDVPLDPASPWPKFRRDAAQTARSDLRPHASAFRPWSFRTGRGVFSSPVVAGDGTVYVGSADRSFYALTPRGRLRWRVRTGQIIDSAALLDDRGRVYFGSGDGHLYARDARTGAPVWDFAAAPPESTGAFINWFEGNVAVTADGTLIAPNDNFRIYGVGRDDGQERFSVTTRDQTWALPAVDVAGAGLVAANNYFLGGQPNVFGLQARDGGQRWEAEVDGSVVASPLLTAGGVAIAGGFDGSVHAWSTADGRPLWTFATRGHIYASAAQLPDGTVVVPSADGTIYALDPDTGAERWRYDTLNPIRSSPAVDAVGNVYVGSGDGRLIVLDRRGRLRWAMGLTTGRRATLNASPALGPDEIVIADSEGTVFGVPYDWCLRARSDARCVRPPALPRRQARVLFTSPFGVTSERAPRTIDANQPLALSLDVRAAGRTRLALVDRPSVRVRTRPSVPVTVKVSGDRRYLLLQPRRPLAHTVAVSVTGRYLVDPQRTGLAMTGGRPGGRFASTFRFRTRRGNAAGLPLPVPRKPGDSSGVWLLNRLALPLPSQLPSYNQIGFDSLDFLLGLVGRERDGRAVAWLVGANDPATTYLVPFTVDARGGLLDLRNDGGASVVLNGFTIGLADWRITAAVDAGGRIAGPPKTALTVDCGQIGFYGPFLEQLGLCAPGLPMRVFGGAQMQPYRGGVQHAPPRVGAVRFAREGDDLVAHIDGSTVSAARHSVAVLALDARTGAPVPLAYGTGTTRTTDAAGNVDSVRVPLAGHAGPLRAVLMVDAYPAARGAV